MTHGIITGPAANSHRTGPFHSAIKCSRVRPISLLDTVPSIVAQYEEFNGAAIGDPIAFTQGFQDRRKGYWMEAFHLVGGALDEYRPWGIAYGTPESEWGLSGKLVVVHGSGPPGPWTPGGWGVLHADGEQSILTVLPWSYKGWTDFKTYGDLYIGDGYRSQVWGPTWGTLLQFDPIADVEIHLAGFDPSTIDPTTCASFEEITIEANESYTVEPSASVSSSPYTYAVAVFYPERHPSDLGLS